MNRRIEGWTLLMALPLLAQTALVGAADCDTTVQELQQSYNKVVDTCPGANGEPQAAYFCSGLVLRGTKRPEHFGQPEGSFYTFQTSPNAQAVGTTAATYIRDDINFQDFTVMGDEWTNFNDGYILESAWDVANDEDKSFLACAVPRDMWAYDRADQGCGDNSKTPENEGPSCAAQGVTGDTWTATYFDPYKHGETQYIGGKSCAFDMRTLDNQKSSDAFLQFLKARQAMENDPTSDEGFKSYPEVRFTNPKSGNAAVKAFFYTDTAGREAALKNQQDYKKVTGKDVPIVQVEFPKKKGDKVTFSCDAKPAPGPAPVPAAGTDPAEVAAGGWGTGSDPKQCSSYIKEVKWINRWDYYLGRHVDSVSVVPTDCGREIGPDQTDKAFAELKQKATALPGGAAKWNNRDGTLRRQFVCHIVLEENGLPVRYKREYNLEPIRKEVSHEQSLVDHCNPPLTDDGMIGGWGPDGSPQCTQYVSSVRWVPRKFTEYPGETIMSLEVIPTDCGRKIGPDQTDKMMKEIKDKALAADPRGAEYWGNKDRSMRNQTICLMKLYRDKKEWNIESKRPNETSLADVEAAQCNHK